MPVHYAGVACSLDQLEDAYAPLRVRLGLLAFDSVIVDTLDYSNYNSIIIICVDSQVSKAACIPEEASNPGQGTTAIAVPVAMDSSTASATD